MRKIYTRDVTTILDLALKLEKAFSKLSDRLDDYNMKMKLVISSPDSRFKVVDCEKGMDIIADLSAFVTNEAKVTELEEQEAASQVAPLSYPKNVQQELDLDNKGQEDYAAQEEPPVLPDDDFIVDDDKF